MAYHISEFFLQEQTRLPRPDEKKEQFYIKKKELFSSLAETLSAIVTLFHIYWTHRSFLDDKYFLICLAHVIKSSKDMQQLAKSRKNGTKSEDSLSHVVNVVCNS